MASSLMPAAMEPGKADQGSSSKAGRRFDACSRRIAALQQSRLLQRSRERISDVSQLTDVRGAMSHSSRKAERAPGATTRTDARRALDTARADVWQVERAEIGRAHVCTPVTNAHLVCRLLLEK